MPVGKNYGLAVTEPIVHAPKATQVLNRYRSNMGMVPSAEFSVYMDDFLTAVTTNVPTGWTAAVIDTGATAVVQTTAALGSNGAILMSDATASEGIAIYGTKSIQLTANKKFFMEIRFQTDDVTDNVFQFGLTDLTATTNPEDLWTTVAANLVAFGILDGSAYPTMLADKSNSGTTAQAQTVSPLTASAWQTMAIYFDGVNLFGYVNGLEVLTWSSAAATIPTGVALAPFIGVLNGNGAGANVNTVDYIRYVAER